jgi:hypothetical protein
MHMEYGCDAESSVQWTVVISAKAGQRCFLGEWRLIDTGSVKPELRGDIAEGGACTMGISCY